MLNPDKLNPDIFCRPGKKRGDIGDSGDKRVNTGVSVSPLLKTFRGHMKPTSIPVVPVVPTVPVEKTKVIKKTVPTERRNSRHVHLREDS